MNTSEVKLFEIRSFSQCLNVRNSMIQLRLIIWQVTRVISHAFLAQKQMALAAL